MVLSSNSGILNASAVLLCCITTHSSLMTHSCIFPGHATDVYDATLSRLLSALAQCASPIAVAPDRYQRLVSTVLKYNWDRPAAISKAVLHFLTNLVSANGCFLISIYTSIVKNFLIPIAPASPDFESTDEAAFSSPASLAKWQTLLHALRSLLVLVPLSCTSLLPILAENFPHRRLAAPRLVSYMRQLLHIAEHVSVLRSHIFALIIGKIIEIDVC